MRQKLFTVCSIVSLLLCVAVCVLWVRSYFASDVIEITGRVRSSRKPPPRVSEAYRDYQYVFGSAYGVMRVNVPAGAAVPQTEVGDVEWKYDVYDLQLDESRLQYLWTFKHWSYGIDRTLVFPVWVILLFTIPMPVVWLYRRRRERRLR